MRIFFFLLILANLLFFAWTRDYLGLSPDAEAFRMHQQLRADQVRIVSNDEPPPEVTRAAKELKAAETPPEVCLSLFDIPQVEAEALEKLLAEKLPSFRMAQEKRPGNASFWIHIPPLKNKREAENKVAELKKFGVKEYFIVQESGPNNLAISLGVFSTREAATAALEALRGKGVRSARVGERAGKPAWVQLELRGPASQSEELHALLGDLVPGARQEACQQRGAATQ